LQHSRRNSDLGVTKVRNVASPHWRRSLGVQSRAVVPFTSFSANGVLADGSRPPPGAGRAARGSSRGRGIMRSGAKLTRAVARLDEDVPSGRATALAR